MTAARTDTLDPGMDIPRHAHAGAYAAVVLAGGYEEAGDGGRFRVEAGDVLVHAAFSSHLDRTPRPGTRVLNLPLPWLWTERSRRMRLGDPDAAARLAEGDAVAAARWLRSALEAGGEGLDDAPDRLASALSAVDPAGVAEWSDGRGVARETAWRWFSGAYGVGPARYRVEARARRAWRRLAGGDEGLAHIALSEGFADQAHMGRDVRALTGRTPGAWRALQHSFKTAAD